MSNCVVYIYPPTGATAMDNALRFVTSYHTFPSGAEHEMIVVCNGRPADDETRLLFSPIPHCRLVEHNNVGYDIGAFQRLAREVTCDMMVFFGSSAYIRGPNWLARMGDAFNKHGSKLYGCMENSGHIAVGVYPHIRTTGFWMSPLLLNQYPHQVTTPEQRYPFEHGRDCLTSWCLKRCGAMVVTWEGEYGIEHWGRIPGGFHRHNQEALITGDKNSAPPYYHVM